MKRNFCVGSEWLYYKIYTGVKTTDIVLQEKLYPVIENLKKEKILNKWFFIRYKDPHEHFRIRFYSENPENSTIIIARLFPVLNELLEQDIVWKIQTDTYQRETERYGVNCIEDSETLFWHDSELVMRYLSIKSSFIKQETQLLFSFLAIDTFLNSFLLTNSEKLKVMDDLQSSFKKEFAADKTLKKELDKHYRELACKMQNIISGNLIDVYPEIYAVILGKQCQTKEINLQIKRKLQIPLSSFLSSHIHMMVNRQYTSKQRQYELVIYNYLYRYYKTKEFMPVSVAWQ